MGRIRSIKPEFFVHEGLYEAERASGLPLRVAFVGLWCQADRDGRFLWRPRALKLAVLPWDEVDFSAVLDALEAGGWLERYGDAGEYGRIPSWEKHQKPNHKELPSSIPCPTPHSPRDHRVTTACSPGDDAATTAQPPRDHGATTPLSPGGELRACEARGEREGERELEGELEVSGCEAVDAHAHTHEVEPWCSEPPPWLDTDEAPADWTANLGPCESRPIVQHAHHEPDALRPLPCTPAEFAELEELVNAAKPPRLRRVPLPDLEARTLRSTVVKYQFPRVKAALEGLAGEYERPVQAILRHLAGPALKPGEKPLSPNGNRW